MGIVVIKGGFVGKRDGRIFKYTKVVFWEDVVELDISGGDEVWGGSEGFKRDVRGSSIEGVE